MEIRKVDQFCLNCIFLCQKWHQIVKPGQLTAKMTWECGCHQVFFLFIVFSAIFHNFPFYFSISVGLLYKFILFHSLLLVGSCLFFFFVKTTSFLPEMLIYISLLRIILMNQLSYLSLGWSFPFRFVLYSFIDKWLCLVCQLLPLEQSLEEQPAKAVLELVMSCCMLSSNTKLFLIGKAILLTDIIEK